jgi:hypothetical protein
LEEVDMVDTADTVDTVEAADTVDMEDTGDMEVPGVVMEDGDLAVSFYFHLYKCDLLEKIFFRMVVIDLIYESFERK